MRFFKRKHIRGREINPEDIFLDASKLTSLDRGRLEGHIERPIDENPFRLISIVLVSVFVILLVQAGKLQIVEGSRHAARSEENRLHNVVLFAERGAILDRNGTVLVSNEVLEEDFPTRTYRTPGFSHVLGTVSYPKKDSSGFYFDTEIVGTAGVEAAFDTTLQGTNGTLLIEEDAFQNTITQGKTVPAVQGTSITLSIDARAQEAFFTAVAELSERIPFVGGAAILMDVTTGEIHALVSYPEFNSNILSQGSPRETIASYQTDSRLPFLHRAISGLYAPGSIVKPIVGAGALTDGIIDPEKIIVSTGALVLPNPYFPDNPTIFPDWKPLGPMNMRSAIAYSSDVYFYTVGGGFGDQLGLGIERLAHWYTLFGFGKPTNIELSGEATGFVPTPLWKKESLNEEWGIGNTYHTSIGQYAMQITPIEAVRAIAAIANGGKILSTTLVKDATPRGESVALSPDVLSIVKEGMRQAVTEGTAKGLSLPFTTIAAKTGTAQLGYAKQFVNAWVVGFFPYEQPKYAFAVVMERGPQSNLVGGVYVARTALTTLFSTAPEYFR